MIYLATPYSHRDPQVVEKRFEMAEALTAALIMHTLPIFSPIVHCHRISNLYDMPTDAESWEAYNTAFLRKSDYVYVGAFPGWVQSKGVMQEITLAKQLRIPVYYVGTDGAFISMDDALKANGNPQV